MTITKNLFKKRIARSIGGDIVLIVFLAIVGYIMLLPFIYTVSTALKPADELWLFPPRFFVHHPTLKNFRDLFSFMSDSWVPFSRYVFNTCFMTVLGTVGSIIVCSMCAYPISKYKFPFANTFFKIVTYALMFGGAVTAIPSFIIITKLQLLDTPWAIIIPNFGSAFNLFVMKQFMDTNVNPYILESADLDGASEWTKFIKIVMPMVKPAWLTILTLTFNGLWTMGASNYIYTEQFKSLHYAMNQIAAAGVARMGVGGAVQVIIFSVPLIIFILSQSSMMETMSTSGMKD